MAKFITVEGQVKTTVMTYPVEKIRVNVEAISFIANSGIYYGSIRILVDEKERARIEHALDPMAKARASRKTQKD